ncbi:hypothetical protein C0J52_27026 [Blattella germanica]|nr:hypothetical protein C0J52_27026 [Blattella germanica]
MGGILCHLLGCKEDHKEDRMQCPIKEFFQKIFPFFRSKAQNGKDKDKSISYYALRKPSSTSAKLNRQLIHLNNLINASNSLDSELHKLAREEKKFITESWHAFMRLPPANSVDAFVKFLQENPKYIKFFKSVDGIPLEDLRYSFRVPKHVTAVLLYVNSMVHCLDNADAMFFLSLQVGLMHSNMGLTVEDFKLFNGYMVNILEDELGLNDEGVAVWNKVLEIFMYVFYVGLEIQ